MNKAREKLYGDEKQSDFVFLHRKDTFIANMNFFAAIHNKKYDAASIRTQYE